MVEPKSYIIESIQSGDIRSFEIVFKTYYNRLCIYANSYIHDSEQTKLIVNDVFVRIWETRSELKIETSLDGYLYKSVYNHCLNYLQREKKKWSLVSADLECVLSDDNESGHPISDDYPMNDLLLLELNQKLEKAIQTLPPQCREVFILNRMENLSNEEISLKLNLSVGTVKSQLFRALSKLRVELSEYFPFLLLGFQHFF